MKILYICIVVSLIVNPVFADFTVQKVNETIGKIITTETITKEDNVTILSLKQKKANLLLNKEQALAQYNNTIKTIDSEVALIDSQIIELGKAGITEAKVEEIP